MINKKMVSLLLAFSMIFSIFFPNVTLAETLPLQIGTVDFKIEAKTVGDGVLLDEKSVPLYEGDTPTTILSRVTTGSSIQVDETNGLVSSISKDGKTYGSAFGPEKSIWWGISVNNDVGSWEIPKLKDGDLIRWHYTVKGNTKDVLFIDIVEQVQLLLEDAKKELANAKSSDHEALLNTAINKTEEKLGSIESFGGVSGFIDAHSASEIETLGIAELKALIQELSDAIHNGGFVPATQVKITKKPNYILENQQFQYMGEVIPSNATNQKIQWEVEEKSGKATITPEGLFTALEVGEVIVKAKHEDLADQVPATHTVMIREKSSLSIDEQIQMATDTVATWVEKNSGFESPYVSGNNVEWNALGIARYGNTVSQSYVDGIENYFAKYKDLESLKKDFNQSTDFARVIIGLGAVGSNPEKIGNFNLVQEIYNHDNLDAQGINGPSMALIALDTHKYIVPEDAKYTRDKIIEMILKEQHQDGGFGESDITKPSDVDRTAMAIQALSTYYNKRADVTTAVDQALNWLSVVQDSSGGYIAKDGNKVSVESTVQVICALTSLEKNPLKEERFIKSNGNIFTAVMTFYNEADGGFKTSQEYNERSISLTSQQVLYCLTSYKRMLAGQTKLYDMSDVVQETPIEKQEIKVTEETAKDPIVILEGQDKSVHVAIQDTISDAVKLDLTAIAMNLPSIVAIKGNLSMEIPRNTKITEGTGEVNLFGKPQHQNNEKLLSDSLDKTMQLDKVDVAFKVGNLETITFDNYITLRIKDMGTKQAAYVDQQGKLHLIQKVENDQAGIDKSEYCYKDNRDLVIRTKHFTDFMVYSASEKPGTGGGGGDKPDSIKIKVEASAVGRGTLYPLQDISYKNGDTPYSVLERTGLDIVITGSGSSVYVKGISGIGEYDYGQQSGWMWSVNGDYIQISAGGYKLQPGDTLIWSYTKNGGEDIGDTGNTGGGGGAGATVELEKNPIVDPTVDKNQPEVPTVEEKDGIESTYKDFEKVSTWAKADLKKAVELGIISGYGDTLKPQQAVTRAEFTAMLVRLLKLETVSATSGAFKDVTSQDWFASSIYTAHQAKIISGVSKDTFMPHGIITREEVAVILQRIVQREVVEAPKLEDEKQISPWAKEAIDAACSNKLMRAEQGKFNPKQNVTREMAAVLLLRVSESGKLK